ncbi:UMP-CMP kinase isoform b [Camelus ferus]|nr:UMP-CMP kinase isoform b [Camelus ferus]
MLSSCGRWLLHVLGLSFQLLSHRPLFLCPHRLMRPQVVSSSAIPAPARGPDNEISIDRCLERGESSGRSDDNRESLEKRIQAYLQSTKPIIDLHEEMGKVKKIDASKSADEVFDEVVKIFDKANSKPEIKPCTGLLQEMKLSSRKVKASGKSGSESRPFPDAIPPDMSFVDIFFVVCLILPKQN